LNGGRISVHRERSSLIPGQDPAPSLIEIPAVAGPPAAGTDGTQASHYTSAKKGFVPDFTVTTADVEGYNNSKTITASGVTVKVNQMPGLIAELFDFLAKKQKNEQLDAAIAKAIAAVH
jgi:hypothetical protein